MVYAYAYAHDDERMHAYKVCCLWMDVGGGAGGERTIQAKQIYIKASGGISNFIVCTAVRSCGTLAGFCGGECVRMLVCECV